MPRKIYDTAEFGAALRAKRKSLGYTQTQLAEFCNCSLSYLSDLERGKPTAEIGKALLILNTLGLTMSIEDRSGELK